VGAARRKKKYSIIAVDEAGRGPLAGPITVAAVAATVNHKSQITNHKQIPNSKIQNSKTLKNIRDSKKFSPKQRNEWLEILKKNFEYKVAMVGPQIIDRIGIQKATCLAVARVLRKMRVVSKNKLPDLVLLDGLLKAPKHYRQQTIIKGDQKIPLISAASIIAKVYRDKKMQRLHKIYPEYCFDCHKGYGTKLHYKKIKKNGPSDCHRHSFRIL
jgi:ribonuclease HII